MATIIYYDAMGRGADMSDMDGILDVYDGGPGRLDDIDVTRWDSNTDRIDAWYDGGDLYLILYVSEIRDPIYLLETAYAFDFFGNSLADFQGINLRFNINDDFSNGVTVSNALSGGDYVEGNNYSDFLNGFNGNDVLVGLGGNDTLDGGSGSDDMYGGAGADIYWVNSTGDRVFETSLSGVDSVISSVSYSLPDYVEGLGLFGSASINGYGNSYDNVMLGNSGNNYLWGGAGDDIMTGEAGNDRLAGGAGRDTVTGGAGRDVFDFDKASDSGPTSSTRDVIKGFTRGSDWIDLSSIDANTTTAVNDAFKGFIGGSLAFTKPGQLKFVNGVLYANTDFDSAAEISIQLSGVSSLSMADIIL